MSDDDKCVLMLLMCVLVIALIVWADIKWDFIPDLGTSDEPGCTQGSPSGVFQDIPASDC